MPKEIIPTVHINKKEILYAASSGTLIGASLTLARLGLTGFVCAPMLFFGMKIGATGIHEYRERIKQIVKSAATPGRK